MTTDDEAKRPCPFCAEPIPVAEQTCHYCGNDTSTAEGKRPCPHCKETIAAADRTCRYCGHDTALPAPAEQRAGTFIEWEQPGRGVFARWWITWAGTQFGFEKFWARVPYSGGFGPPTRFALFGYAQMVLLGALCYTPFALLMIVAGMQNAPADGPTTGVILGIILAVIVLGIPLLILIGWVSLYVTAGVYHVCVLMLGGRGPFEATFRAIAYTTGSAWWSIVCCVCQIVFQTIGLTHAFSTAHNMTKTRACIAALIPQLLQFLALVTPYVILIAMSIARTAGR